jgi:hypothetical protein
MGEEGGGGLAHGLAWGVRPNDKRAGVPTPAARGLDLNQFELIQVHSNLIQTKTDFPELENFQIKYGAEGFEIGNKFAYMNFFQFLIESELKIREDSRVWIWMEFTLEPQDLMKFGSPVCTYMANHLWKGSWIFWICS